MFSPPVFGPTRIVISIVNRIPPGSIGKSFRPFDARWAKMVHARQMHILGDRTQPVIAWRDSDSTWSYVAVPGKSRAKAAGPRDEHQGIRRRTRCQRPNRIVIRK